MDPRTLIRIVRVVLIVAAVALAAVPLLVLLDLAGGGTGYGICPGGVDDCTNPYRTVPQLVLVLSAGLALVLAGLRLTTVALQRYRRRRVPPGTED